MKVSLQVKLIISYVLLSMFLVFSLLFISNHALEAQFQKYILSQQEQKNVEVVREVLDEFVQNDHPSEKVLKKIGQDALDQGLILTVNDYSGNKLFDMNNANRMQCHNMLESKQEMMHQRYSDWKGEYKERTYQLVNDSQHYGTVTLGYYGPFYYNDIDVEFIEMINKLFFYAALIFLLAAIGLGFFIAKKISKPIEMVMDKTKEIERGHYSDRINIFSNTYEIDQLIGCVNHLANSLEQQQKIKKRMANDYAHEFRTPLATLQSNFEGMIDGIFKATPERLESCREEVLRLSRMVTEIDKITEIENHPMTLQKEKFDLALLVEQILLNFHHDLVTKNIELETNLEMSEICGDKDKISQVIINLISNGIKYTDDGKITIKVKDDVNDVVLSVQDTGIGIDAEDIPHIFEHLYRIDRSRTRDTGGSGIGLSIVKAIIDAHGGEIEVRSIPSKGSEFIVRLNKC